VQAGSKREVQSRWLPVSETVAPVPVGLDQVTEREVRSRWLPVSETVAPVPVGPDQVVERTIRSRWLPVSETVAPVPVGFGYGSSSLGGSRDRSRKDCGTGLVSIRLPGRLIYPAIGCPHSGLVAREGSAIVGPMLPRAALVTLCHNIYIYIYIFFNYIYIYIFFNYIYIFFNYIYIFIYILIFMYIYYTHHIIID